MNIFHKFMINMIFIHCNRSCILLASKAIENSVLPLPRSESMKKGTSQTMSTIPESHLDILQSTAVAYMATIGPKGEPQASPVLFGWDGTHLFFSMNKIRQKHRNLLREPQVAIAIADPTNPYRSLEIRGKV